MGVSKQLSWSVSRSKSLKGCLRAHWFSKWVRGEQEERKARQLDSLVNLDMLAGLVVDWQVNLAIDELRAGRELPSNLDEFGARTWHNMLAKSQREAALMRAGKSLPVEAQPLIADYYGIPRNAEDILKREEKVRRALIGFTGSSLLKRLKTIHRSRWMPQRREGTFNAVKWSLAGIQVWSALDFWLDYKEKGFVIIDWKSGTFVSEDEGIQLAAYSVYAQEVKGLPRDKVLVQAAHLPEIPTWNAKPISEMACNAVRLAIQSETATERALVEEAEQSDGKVIYVADRDKFPPTVNQRVCEDCKFRAICPEGSLILRQS